MFRSTENSFLLGAIEEESYRNRNKRRLVSLEICLMSWFYEMAGVILTVLTPTLISYGLRYVHYPDAILMFVAIPFIHLMNDENTKTVITQDGWIQGLRLMLGSRNQIAP